MNEMEVQMYQMKTINLIIMKLIIVYLKQIIRNKMMKYIHRFKKISVTLFIKKYNN